MKSKGQLHVHVASRKFGWSKLVGGVTLMVACTGVAAPAATGADQSEEATAFQIDASHAGSIAFAAGFSAPLAKLWSFTTGSGASYPLIAEGKVFVLSGGANVFAINAFTGNRLWKHAVSDVSNTGAYDNGRLFLHGFQGQTTALNATNGKQIWSVTLAAYSATTPIAVAGEVFLAGQSLVALDEATGALKWSRGIEATDGTPAYGDNGVYVGGPAQYYKFVPDGTPLWHNSGCCEGGGGISPAYFQGRVYLVDWAEGNFTLRASNGAFAGTFPGQMPPTFFIAADGRPRELVVTNGKLYCIKVKTGDVAWSRSDLQLSVPPIAINGQPVVGTSSGLVVMLDGMKGKLLWSDSVGGGVRGLNGGDGVLAVSAGNTVTVFGPQ